MTINRSLRYLVTEEIEEQNIVYGQTDGRMDGRTDRQTDDLTTDERVSHELDLSSTSRVKNVYSVICLLRIAVGPGEKFGLGRVRITEDFTFRLRD